MSGRLFLDTNILIDYLAVRQPFYQNARKLMVLGMLGEYELWMCTSQMTDVFYVLSEGGKQALGPSCQERLRLCRQWIHLCALTERDVDAALDLGWNDLEDACLSICAEKLNTYAIITRDADFPQTKRPLFDAAGFFTHLQETQNIVYEELTLGVDT